MSRQSWRNNGEFWCTLISQDEVKYNVGNTKLEFENMRSGRPRFWVDLASLIPQLLRSDLRWSLLPNIFDDFLVRLRPRCLMFEQLTSANQSVVSGTNPLPMLTWPPFLWSCPFFFLCLKLSWWVAVLWDNTHFLLSPHFWHHWYTFPPTSWT